MKKTTTIIAMLLITLNSIATPIIKIRKKSVTVVSEDGTKITTPFLFETQSIGTAYDNQEVVIEFTKQELSVLYILQYDDSYSNQVAKYIKAKFPHYSSEDVDIVTDKAINLLQYIIGE